MIDLTDFSQGIVTDPDPLNRPAGSAEDLVNVDTYAGRLVKRPALSRYLWPVEILGEEEQEYLPRTDETVLQVVQVDAPLSDLDSVPGFPDDAATPRRITFVLVAYFEDELVDAYRIYGNIKDATYWTRILPPGWGMSSSTHFWSLPGEIPYMVARKNGVAIGNVRVPTNASQGMADPSSFEPGIYWIGRIKNLVGYRRTITDNEMEEPEFINHGYLTAVSGWAMTAGELYNAQDQIHVQMLVSSYEECRRAGSDAWSRLVTLGGILEANPDLLLKALINPMLVNNEKRKLRFKVTAVYDRFQESRPLRWGRGTDDAYGPAYRLIGNTDRYDYDWGKAQLPFGWKVYPDAKTGQELTVEIGEVEPHAYSDITAATREYGGGGDLICRMNLVCRWNRRFDDTLPKDQSGNGIELHVRYPNVSPNQSVESAWFWETESTPQGPVLSKIILQPQYIPWPETYAPWNDLHGVQRNGVVIEMPDHDAAFGTNVWPVRFLAMMLGFPCPFAETDNTATMSDADFFIYSAYYGWTSTSNIRHQGLRYFMLGTHPRILDLLGKLRVVSLALDAMPGETPTDPNNQVISLTFGDSHSLGVFTLQEGNGWGLLAFAPLVPTALLDPALKTTQAAFAANRLTAFRFYMQRADIDPDFMLLREMSLDYRDLSRDHGGTGSLPKLTDEYGADGTFFDERETDVRDLPVWMEADTLLQPHRDAEYPYDLVSGDMSLAWEALGGLHPRFIVSGADLVDTPGSALLSASLLRDEVKRDNPQWRRGSICAMRMLGVHAVNGEMQYSVIANGVPQWDIMPGTFPIGINEELVHIVTWRGTHHMLFSTENLWRLNMASSDELDWEVLNTYAGMGTTKWMSISVVAEGVVFVNTAGIFLYASSLPISLIEGRWAKDWQEQYAPILDSSQVPTAFCNQTGDLWIGLPAPASESDVPYIWLFSLRGTKSWRKYLIVDRAMSDDPEPVLEQHRYAPVYMTQLFSKTAVADQFVLSLPRQLVMYPDFANTTTERLDKFPSALGGPVGIPVRCITNVIPPESHVGVVFNTHCGIRILQDCQDYMRTFKIRFRAGEYLPNGVKGFRESVLIYLPYLQGEHLFPLPPAFARETQIHIFQGMDNDPELPNDHISEIRGLSLRVFGGERWDNTRRDA